MGSDSGRSAPPRGSSAPGSAAKESYPQPSWAWKHLLFLRVDTYDRPATCHDHMSRSRSSGSALTPRGQD
ncbi:hypothetical protein SHJG_0346 [Streptomyces hygroscopicus subsp. jinggangensis 5008]|nr:hypothetical protein SHJG_0346 [Streptomyces hygroscopicus subsp. jinggangensis 5008]AGF59846.1 hypothetical protein SHJGH_0180 [Streptomyces hygroscopicus subsp. jinggangensis TL01]